MKNFKKIVVFALVATMVFSMVGCGEKDSDGSKGFKDNGGKKVEISYWNSGMGTDFMDKMIAAFNESQSEWCAQYKATADAKAIAATFGLEDADTVDLYMSVKYYDTSKMAPLDDVLNSVAEGDSKTIKEKFTESYLDYEVASDGHYYTLTYGGGTIGIVYNKELFKKAGIETAPRTTNELAAVCDTLKEKDITPFTHFTGGGYWSFIQEVWQAQYDGIDYYMNNFHGCTDANGNSPSKEVFTAKDGRYQVIKAMEKFITPEYVMNGSNSQDHISAQTLFLNQNIGMMANGAWMANEMKQVGSADNFAIMKLPVLSAITDKLTTVKGETELRKLITAIDAVIDGEAELSAYQSGDGYLVEGKNISAADWEYVYTARTSVASNNAGETLCIPSYSDAIEGAKEFVKFFYSDAGYKIYTETLHSTLPMNFSKGEIDTSDWNAYEMSIYNLDNIASNYICSEIMSKHRIYYDGGASTYTNEGIVERLCTHNASDRMSADELWKTIIDKVNNQYDGWLANIK